ncbi:hypothetical protein OG216_02900 [Streptomycetaceae bacterium NBC_01309]
MRVRAGLALATLLFVGVVSGCGGGGGDDGDGVASVVSGKPSATASAGGGSDGAKADGTALAKCMRENGVPEFPDPEANGSMVLPEGVDEAKVDAAMQKCKNKMPVGGDMPQMSAEDLEKTRQFAKCMRDHGIADFPDPDGNGGSIQLGNGTDLDPEDPKLKAAQSKCQSLIPARPGSDAGSGDRK